MAATVRKTRAGRYLDTHALPRFVVSDATTFDGVTVHVTAKAGSTNPVTVFLATDFLQPHYSPATTEFHLLRSTVDVKAAGQAVTVIDGRSAQGDGSAWELVGNRVRVTGGSGEAAILDACRGMLVANNLFALDATSTIGTFFKSTCAGPGTYARRPAQIVNNALWLDDAATAFDLDGAPNTDTGNRVGGNWFHGTGTLVKAALSVPPLSLATPAAINIGRLNGGLDGGNNTNDAACFAATLPADLALFKLAIGSSCVGRAVSPNAARLHGFTTLARDADSTPRDVVNGWAPAGGTGTNDIGPDELP